MITLWYDSATFVPPHVPAKGNKMPATKMIDKVPNTFPWFKDGTEFELTEEGSKLARSLIIRTHYQWRVRFGELRKFDLPDSLLHNILRALLQEGFLVPCHGSFNMNNYSVNKLYRVEASA